MKTPVRVTVTGAAGQISYSLLFRIASGQMLGPDQPVIFQLLEIAPAMKALEGVVMEIDACAFPLVEDFVLTDDINTAFSNVNYALLVGAKPRGPGMERSDLLEANGGIFKLQGNGLNENANRDVKVLVVDDSSFFRRRVSEILEQDSDIQVIGFAINGREAVEKTAQLRPDMITMDVEMPVLDGISAVKEIMASNPTPILMFSSLTRAGATATLDALDAGAMDFLPKKFEDIARNNEDAIKLLQAKVKEIGNKRIPRAFKPITHQKPAARSVPDKISNTASSIRQPDRSFQRSTTASTLTKTQKPIC